MFLNSISLNRVLLFSFLLFSFGFISCAGPRPILEHSLAHKAMQEAKKSKASKLSPKLWRKSKKMYKQAMRLLKEHKNKEAQESFIQARAYAEEAEMKALIKKSKSGEFSW